MRIKHFAGYGCVNATKVKNTKTGDKTRQVIIKVAGNHERGIYRNDYYDIYNWLVKRFCKDCDNYNSIYHIGVNLDYERINNIDTEVCVYTIDYIVNK